jgi:hypothetical protein
VIGDRSGETVAKVSTMKAFVAFCLLVQNATGAYSPVYRGQCLLNNSVALHNVPL